MVNFELTDEQKDIQKAALEFGEGEFDPDYARQCDENHEFPKDIWKKACQLGFIGSYYPEEYGGGGLSVLDNAIIVEALCRKDSTIGTALIVSDFASDIILRVGTHEQKVKWLPKIAGGEMLSAGGFTEPDHGSDITLMNTSAVKDGDEWVINGVKTFITNGTNAGIVVTLCQTDSNASPTYRGQSTIVVETDRPGFEATDLGSKMGIRSTKTAELSYSDVRVPADNLVGMVGKGFYNVLEFFDESRVEIAAQALGIGWCAYDKTLEYVKQRRQFGKPLAALQSVQHKLADMATKLEAAQLLTYKAGWNFDQGRIDPKLTSMAKFYAARAAVEVCEEAVQIHGGYGYMSEYDVERHYRDARITEIYEGTKEIQKNTIASSILGKFK